MATKIPKPGKAVRGSKTGRPIMALLDLLGRRWMLRIMWELRGQPLGFRELQTVCDEMSPSVLSQRISDLDAAGIIESVESRYQLTAEGRDLLQMLGPLHDWAERWGKRLARRAAKK